MSSRTDRPDRLTFDPASGDLAGPRGSARLAPQPAELLALMLRHAGDVVTRESIKEQLWPGGRVEFGQGIAFAVREVRKAIEVAGGDPGIIETIPKRGFRLDAAALTLAGAEAGAAAPPGIEGSGPPPAEGFVDEGGSRAGAFGRWSGPALALVGLASLAAAVGIARSDRAGPPILAVFPHDAADDASVAAATALDTELTAALTDEYRGLLGVIGPTGVAGVSGPNDTEGARNALGACLVMSGSVRGLGVDSLVVFTQIVRASDRVHVWARVDSLPRASAASGALPAIVAGAGTVAGAC